MMTNRRNQGKGVLQGFLLTTFIAFFFQESVAIFCCLQNQLKYLH